MFGQVNTQHTVGGIYFCLLLCLLVPEKCVFLWLNLIYDSMVVERVKNEVIIRLPSFMNIEAIQRTIDLISLKEATARSVATQEDIDLLAKEAKKGWWAKNRERYIK